VTEEERLLLLTVVMAERAEQQQRALVHRAMSLAYMAVGEWRGAIWEMRECLLCLRYAAALAEKADQL
jgi:hypothetical protein